MIIRTHEPQPDPPRKFKNPPVPVVCRNAATNCFCANCPASPRFLGPTEEVTDG